MKNISKIILLGAGILLSLTGCQKGNETENGEKAVNFNILSGMPATRTQYSGDGIKDSDGKLTWERIDWVVGDQITVWSDNAVGRITPSKKYANYVVAEEPSIVDENKVSQSNVVRTTEDGLLYDEANQGADYTFWGAYPAFDGAPVADGKAKFSIPATQTGTASGTGDIVLAPNMSGAYMFGAATAKYGKSFDLCFYPAYTAFEIVIKAAEGAYPIGLESVKLISTTALYGSDIEATIVAGTSTNSKGKTIGATTYSTVAATAANKEITYDFPEGTDVNSTNTLTFTVFAVPQDVVGLSLEFSLSDGTKRTATLKKNGEAITFGACEKNRIYTLAIPEGEWHLYLEADVQEWIDVQNSIEYGQADEGGVVVSASALEHISGASGKIGDKDRWSRTAATLETTTTPLKAYFSVYSPTNGNWRITLKGENAGHFSIATEPAGTTGTDADGNTYIEGAVDGRIIFTLTPTEDAGSGDTVELWFTVVVNGEDYLLHSEVTRNASKPLTVTLP